MTDSRPPDPEQNGESRRVLDPLQRSSETVFGLIMVLTITGSLSIASAGRGEVRTMVLGAIGCNTAWGIVDAVMYLFGGLLERGRGLTILKALRKAEDPERARSLITDSMPPVVASVMRPSELDVVRERLAELPEPPARPPLTRQDFRGAAGVFLLVFLSTLPVVLPFFVFSEPYRAIRISNAVAVTMLFLSGYSVGRYSGMRPVRVGLGMAAIGAVLASVALALGG
ncbi:MAG: VIT1/CCC1 transporter family protein [Acidithiobacillales bacterium]